MWPGLHGTIRASSRTPMPRDVIMRASSVPKSLICVYQVAGQVLPVWRSQQRWLIGLSTATRLNIVTMAPRRDRR
jgi:hypothetical protein